MISRTNPHWYYSPTMATWNLQLQWLFWGALCVFAACSVLAVSSDFADQTCAPANGSVFIDRHERKDFMAMRPAGSAKRKAVDVTPGGCRYTFRIDRCEIDLLKLRIQYRGYCTVRISFPGTNGILTPLADYFPSDYRVKVADIPMDDAAAWRLYQSQNRHQSKTFYVTIAIKAGRRTCSMYPVYSDHISKGLAVYWKALPTDTTPVATIQSVTSKPTTGPTLNGKDGSATTKRNNTGNLSTVRIGTKSETISTTETTSRVSAQPTVKELIHAEQKATSALLVALIIGITFLLASSLLLVCLIRHAKILRNSNVYLVLRVRKSGVNGRQSPESVLRVDQKYGMERGASSVQPNTYNVKDTGEQVAAGGSQKDDSSCEVRISIDQDGRTPHNDYTAVEHEDVDLNEPYACVASTIRMTNDNPELNHDQVESTPGGVHQNSQPNVPDGTRMTQNKKRRYATEGKTKRACIKHEFPNGDTYRSSASQMAGVEKKEKLFSPVQRETNAAAEQSRYSAHPMLNTEDRSSRSSVTTKATMPSMPTPYGDERQAKEAVTADQTVDYMDPKDAISSGAHVSQHVDSDVYADPANSLAPAYFDALRNSARTASKAETCWNEETENMYAQVTESR